LVGAKVVQNDYKRKRLIGMNQVANHSLLTKDNMKSGKNTRGVVVLVAAMLILQLVVAPMAMARSPHGMIEDPLIRVFEEGMGTYITQCGETCVTGACYAAGCHCEWPVCVK
jgi:hypothetical protein